MSNFISVLRNRKQILSGTMDIIQSNLLILEDFFNKHRDIFEFYRPQAGTTVFVQVKGWLLGLGDGGATGFCDTLAKEKNVILLPSDVYGYVDEFVRFGFGKRNMKECVEQLERFIIEYGK